MKTKPEMFVIALLGVVTFLFIAAQIVLPAARAAFQVVATLHQFNLLGR